MPRMLVLTDASAPLNTRARSGSGDPVARARALPRRYVTRFRGRVLAEGTLEEAMTLPCERRLPGTTISEEGHDSVRFVLTTQPHGWLAVVRPANDT